MKKRTLALLLAAVLVLTGLPFSAGAETPASSGFDDVTLTAWYCKDVTYAHALGLVAGVSATEFAPLRTITRGEFVTILGRFLMSLPEPTEPAETGVPETGEPAPEETATPETGEPAPETGEPAPEETAATAPTEEMAMADVGVGHYSPAAPASTEEAPETTVPAESAPSAPIFTDVPETAFYAPYVNWAAANCIVYGIKEGIFAPKQEITRQEIACILYRAEGYPGLPPFPAVNDPATFADAASISGFAREAMAALQVQGILSGNDKGNVQPRQSATRAEATALILRFVSIVQGHAHAYVQTEDRAPTCTDRGVAVYACDCGSLYGKVTAQALGHDFVLLDENATERHYRCARCGELKTAPIPRRTYHGDHLTHNTEVFACIETFAQMYPDLITVTAIGKSNFGTDISMVKLGKGSRYILLNGNLHAREYIGANYLLEVIDAYAYAYATNGSVGGHAIRPLLDKFTLCIIPCFNPDGRDIAIEQGRYDWKENGRGVNLNANFPAFWDPEEEKCGAYAGSEAETQAMMWVQTQYPFELLLDFHTAGNYIYYADQHCSAAFANRSRNLAQAFAQASGYRYGSTYGNGGNCTYARAVTKIPALTVEMIPYIRNPIDCSIFYSEIWSRIDTMPAIAMELLLKGY